MPNVDDLSISITSKADSANDALDRLISKLDRLTRALEKVNGSAINRQIVRYRKYREYHKPAKYLMEKYLFKFIFNICLQFWL